VDTSIKTISKNLLAGDRRALARAISIVEAGGPAASHLVKELFPHTGRAHLVGVTGAPGVGKSTLVDALITEMRRFDLKVGVLAVDPSSPFTGGAILGDRIRMQGHTLDKRVFMRSMANRGHAGGIAVATFDAVRMLDAAGCDVVIIETVGVGQSELAITEAADTTVLVVMPGSGDDVQAIKSGIMEIGDIFVVNKGDLAGANKTATEIIQSMELVNGACPGWRPPVHVATAETGQGIQEIWASIKEHKAYLDSSGQLKSRREAKIEAELEDLVAWLAKENLKESLTRSQHVQKVLARVVKQETDPHSAAKDLIQELFSRQQTGRKR